MWIQLAVDATLLAQLHLVAGVTGLVGVARGHCFLFLDCNLDEEVGNDLHS